MARCGCGGDCSCSVIAGDGIAVAGSGSAGNPFVISANVQCSQVRPCLSAGSGMSYNAATGVFSARPSIDAGNSLVFGTDQGLYVPANQVDCSDVRPCLSGGDGIIYDPVTGLITTRLSTDPGNQAIFGTDNGVYVPTGTTTVVTDCGLVGDGSALSPLAAAVGAWPYPCDVDTNGGVVACGTDGILRSEPRGRVSMTSILLDRNYANLAVPAAADTLVDSFSTNIVNPDPCRSALIVSEREVDVYMIMPAGAGGASGYLGDEMFYTRNSGTTTNTDVHVQSTKVLPVGTLAPGAGTTLTIDVALGRGTGGATYNRILVFIRALLISL